MPSLITIYIICNRFIDKLQSTSNILVYKHTRRIITVIRDVTAVHFLVEFHKINFRDHFGRHLEFSWLVKSFQVENHYDWCFMALYVRIAQLFWKFSSFLNSCDFQLLDAILDAILNNDVGPQKEKLQQTYLQTTNLKQHFGIYKPLFTVQFITLLK